MPVCNAGEPGLDSIIISMTMVFSMPFFRDPNQLFKFISLYLSSFNVKSLIRNDK